nr:MAG TPA: hypothetical protein [Caudoviricetes sp.]
MFYLIASETLKDASEEEILALATETLKEWNATQRKEQYEDNPKRLRETVPDDQGEGLREEDRRQVFG